MKLKDVDIKEITKLLDQHESKAKIASMYHVSESLLEQLDRRYKMHGLEAILHGQSKSYTIDEKIVIINRYYAGESKTSLSTELNVSSSVVNSWIKKYEQMGYNGLIDNRGKPGVSKMGRPKKNKKQTSTTEAMAPVNDAEREELNKLRKENYQLKMENACLKKIQALVQQRQNQQTKKK